MSHIGRGRIIGSQRTRVGLLVAFVMAASPARAQDIGFEGPRFTGAGSTPTESKPESKLWFNDGVWWGSLWSTPADAYVIHRLDFATHTWSDTGVEIDTRLNSHGDALWDGTKLYIATHQFTTGGGSSGNPIRVLRYDYDSSTDTYDLDPGFPVTIGDYSTEALTIAKDSTDVVWAAWTQGSRVRISHTLDSDTDWSTPVVLPRNTTNLTSDDLCGIVHFNGNRIGVLWSDQNANAYRFSVHEDGAADTAWSTVENATSGESDDHLNLAAHGDGRVFFVGKNEANNLLLLVRALNGTWSRHVITQPSPILTRPIVLLNEEAGRIHIFATGQDTGEVFEKTSPLNGISFATGTGTIRMRDSSTVFRISNPTSTKQNVNGTTGLVVLAHHDTTGFYWHHDVLPAPPVAAFGAIPTSGTVPLTVVFTDASVGNVTTRTWSFGDGSSSSATNPNHTYASVGTYTVGLTATGPGGSDTETRTNLIVVLPPPPQAGFSASPTSGQAPLAVTFTDASSGSITSRSWNFGDGGTSSAISPGHIYSSAGTYTVSLTLTGPGGSDTETKTNLITVTPPPPPVADFSASPTSGEAPLAVTFTDASAGLVSSWLWDFGDGATSNVRNPVHTFAAGTFTVSLTVTGPGGSDGLTRPSLIHVSGGPPTQTLLPVADARVSEGSPTTNAGGDVELRVRLQEEGSYHSYLRFDLTGLSGSVTSARLRLFCTDENDVGGQVLPTSSDWNEAGITWANKPAATGGLIASLGAVEVDTWCELDVSAAVSAGGPVSFLLTSTDSGSARYSSREGASPPELVVETSSPVPPVAEFSASPLSGTAPLTVTFTDQSTDGPLSWSWSFGDGATSNAQDPTHVYTEPGIFTVTLVASNAAGSATVTKAGIVRVRWSSPILTFLPVADAPVSEGSPSSNSGSAVELRVRSEASGSYHSYLRFDLTGLSGNVTSARLRLFCTDENDVGGQVFPTSSSWNETGITWANKPAATGAQIASLDTVVADTWYELDVSAAVAAGGPVSFLLVSTDSGSARYSSREGVNPPELVIETSQPVPPLAEHTGGPIVGLIPLPPFESDPPDQEATDAHPVSER